MPPAPDVWMMAEEWSETPLELFVTHGYLLVRGHMTNGPRSIVHIEIMELLEISWPVSVVKGNKRLSDGKRLEFNQSTNQDGSISRSEGKRGRFPCNVEIVNCLNVPLGNRNKCDTNFEAMFSYEILSTDLAL
ncbi:unnamed protein product, partial [Allacma fusca]